MKKLNKLKNGLIRRNTGLLNYALKTGVTVLKHRDDPKKILEEIVGVNPDKLVENLSHYKGSIMKAGQMLSQYGEFYLSPEVNESLKKLHGSTHFLDFETISLQISQKQLDEIVIEEKPLAAASIGQVHKGRIIADDTDVVLKIQYKGIEKAIKGDMVFLKMLTSSLKIFPKGVDTTDVFEEIQKVLTQEMNYAREISVMEKYSNLLQDGFFKVPKVYKELSTEKAICLEFIEGFALGDIKKHNLTQAKLDKIGEKLLELFLREIFEFQLVQTDAHGGNYYVSHDGESVALLDFGACLEFDPALICFYQDFLKYSYELNREGFFKALHDFMEVSGKYLEYDEQILWDYIELISSPWRSNSFDWASTNIHNELIEEAKTLQKSLSFKAIPAQFIFLDRKVLGIFTLLRLIGSKFDMESVFKRIVYA